MFTGIIKEIGRVEAIQSTGGGIKIRIAARESVAGLNRDDSVAVNGVCLTVLERDESSFEVEAVEETLAKTSLGSVRAGAQLNLERPLRLQDRLDGHVVLGHVDAVGTVERIDRRESSWMFSVAIPPDFLHLVVHTGSIAIDGVSLTVATLDGAAIQVSIIPHTMSNTIFRHYRPQDTVNLEFDVIGKYIERLLRSRPPQSPAGQPGEERVLSEAHLRSLGF
jgi:riboflavin synthase